MASASTPLFGVAALVQSTTSVFASPTTAGNTIIMSCFSSSASDDITVIADLGGNTYVRAAKFPSSLYASTIYTFYALNIASTSGNFITSATGGACILYWLQEFSGLPTSGSIIDGAPTGAQGGSGACDPGAITTTNANDLIYGIGRDNATGTGGNLAAGYSLGLSNSGGGNPQASEYKVVSSTGTYDPNYTTSGVWACQGIAFKQAGSAVGPKRRIIN